MSFAPPDGPLPELTTTRVGGGRSARLMALVVTAVLVGVVGVALINQPPPPAPIAAALPTASPPLPVATPPRATPNPSTTVFEVPPQGARPVYDGYGIELIVGGQSYPGLLYGSDTDRLSTAFSIPASLAVGDATLNLAKVRSTYSHAIIEPIGGWQVPLAHLTATALGGSTLLDELVKAQPSQLDAPSLVQAGYEVVVRASATANSADLLSIDVVPQPPVRNQLQGNDGIFGWPVVAQLNDYRAAWRNRPHNGRVAPAATR